MSDAKLELGGKIQDKATLDEPFSVVNLCNLPSFKTILSPLHVWRAGQYRMVLGYLSSLADRILHSKDWNL